MMVVVKSKWNLLNIKTKMENYELSEYKDRCQYGIEAIRSCRLCLFNALCNLERNVRWSDTHEQERTL